MRKRDPFSLTELIRAERVFIAQENRDFYNKKGE